VATGGFGKTLSSVSSDAGALEGRRADAEIGLDKLLAKLEEVISTTTKLDADIQEFDSLPPERKTDKQIRAMNKIRAKVDELGDQVTAGLDKIAAKNPKLDRMQVEIAKVQKIVDALQAAADSPVNSLAKYEQIMTLFAGAAIGVASLGTGIATWSDEGAFFVVIGGIADGLDELNTAFGD
jgi:chromosome segregation ATPase